MKTEKKSFLAFAKASDIKKIKKQDRALYRWMLARAESGKRYWTMVANAVSRGKND